VCSIIAISVCRRVTYRIEFTVKTILAIPFRIIDGQYISPTTAAISQFRSSIATLTVTGLVTYAALLTQKRT
jgi:hypothetical protein